MKEITKKLNTIKINDNIKYIIKIQKIVRKFLIKKNILIPSSYYQTKQWRKNRYWYNGGKHNECEKYQIKLIEKILKININKTHERLNIENLTIMNIKYPLKNNNGYEFTENFDGKITINNKIYYFNLKFVCDNGGAQNRTLREVYHFIKTQIKYLINNNDNNIYFINILDGDTCYNNQNKFNYLFLNEKIENIFIGDIYTFQKKKYLFNI